MNKRNGIFMFISRTFSRTRDQRPERDWAYIQYAGPKIFLGYFKAFATVVAVMALFYAILRTWQLQQSDVGRKASIYAEEIHIQNRRCAQDYEEHMCSQDMFPVLRDQCDLWFVCMRRDPMDLAWAKISAETASDTFNGFFYTLHWKTVGIFLLFCVALATIASIWLRAGQVVGDAARARRSL